MSAAVFAAHSREVNGGDQIEGADTECGDHGPGKARPICPMQSAERGSEQGEVDGITGDA